MREIELKPAIEYFEDAIKESDEIIDECSDDLKAELANQKEYFITAVKTMKYFLIYNDCDGCRWEGRIRHQKCSACLRNIGMKDCYEGR